MFAQANYFHEGYEGAVHKKKKDELKFKFEILTTNLIFKNNNNNSTLKIGANITSNREFISKLSKRLPRFKTPIPYRRC